MFLTNFTVPNKQFFRAKLLTGLCCQVFHSQAMFRFKLKLLSHEEKVFCSKTELLNLKFTLPLAKLDIVGSKPV